MEDEEQYMAPKQSSQPYGTATGGMWNLEQQGDYTPAYSTGDCILVDFNFSFVSKSLKLINEATISVPQKSSHQHFRKFFIVEPGNERLLQLIPVLCSGHDRLTHQLGSILGQGNY